MGISNTYTLKVQSVIQETADSVTLCFKQPALKKIKYQPGQYLTVIFNINGRRYIRPYSFSSAPGIDSTLNITVKRVPGGVVSNHIVDKIKADDILEVFHPMGDFTLEAVHEPAGQNLVLWGVGSGITPLISIAKHVLHNKLCRHITLVYGNRNYESVIFLKTINELLGSFPEAFAAWHFHTQAVVDENNPYLIKGRINPQQVIDVLGTERDIQHTYHYICGPAGLKESVKNVLATVNISSERIFTEDFELVRDPADFENIVTRTVELLINNQPVELEVSKGKSILEAGLDALIDLSYSCQTGSCLLCKGKLLEGETKTIGISSLPEGLEPDERLLCCSFPLTDNIKIAV
jgi:ring-1,2-phenylacetyl-CoA epoxidase subunit PaaE